MSQVVIFYKLTSITSQMVKFRYFTLVTSEAVKVYCFISKYWKYYISSGKEKIFYMKFLFNPWIMIIEENLRFIIGELGRSICVPKTLVRRCCHWIYFPRPYFSFHSSWTNEWMYNRRCWSLPSAWVKRKSDLSWPQAVIEKIDVKKAFNYQTLKRPSVNLTY